MNKLSKKSIFAVALLILLLVLFSTFTSVQTKQSVVAPQEDKGWSGWIKNIISPEEEIIIPDEGIEYKATMWKALGKFTKTLQWIGLAIAVIYGGKFILGGGYTFLTLLPTMLWMAFIGFIFYVLWGFPYMKIAILIGSAIYAYTKYTSFVRALGNMINIK